MCLKSTIHKGVLFCAQQYEGDGLTFDAENHPNDNCTFEAIKFISSTGHHSLGSTQNAECWKDCQRDKNCIAWYAVDYGEGQSKTCVLYKHSSVGTFYWLDGQEGSVFTGELPICTYPNIFSSVGFSLMVEAFL